jgi:hypothetical protein
MDSFSYRPSGVFVKRGVEEAELIQVSGSGGSGFQMRRSPQVPNCAGASAAEGDRTKLVDNGILALYDDSACFLSIWHKSDISSKSMLFIGVSDVHDFMQADKTILRL